MTWLHGLILASILGWQAAGSPAPKQEAKAAPPVSPSPKAEPEADSANRPANAPAPVAKKAQGSKAKAAGPARPAGGKASVGPRILTRGEMQKARSPFLDMPGGSGAPADRYNPDAADWRDVPPWRQTSFFGLRAQGRFFIYVIDCSESMIDEDRFARATMEVRRSVMALQAPQQFEVIFFNDQSMPMPGGPRPRPADTQNKGQLLSWLRLVEPDGGTDPRAAIKQAISLRPEAVFLLSDGALPDGTVEAVAHFNARRIPIHCVDLSGGEGGDHLRRIARDSGGQYAARDGNLQGKR
jgi:Mg-chelatase subunit ChlD